jgi:hypothetical protein
MDNYKFPLNEVPLSIIPSSISQKLEELLNEQKTEREDLSVITDLIYSTNGRHLYISNSRHSYFLFALHSSIQQIDDFDKMYLNMNTLRYVTMKLVSFLQEVLQLRLYACGDLEIKWKLESCEYFWIVESDKKSLRLMNNFKIKSLEILINKFN